MTIETQPGKFEGEPLYVRHLYDVVLDGGSDETLYDGDTPVDVFFVDAELVRQFPELDGIHAVVIWESDSGFVYSAELQPAELLNLIESFRLTHDEE